KQPRFRSSGALVIAVAVLLSHKLLPSFVQALLTEPSRTLRVHRAAEASSGEPAESSEPEEEDTTNVELFRQSLIQGWGSGSSVGSASGTSDWAEPIDAADVRAGDVLLGDPASFFGEGGSVALKRVGLQERIPADYPRRERLRYLPVVLLTEVDKERGTAQGVWLTLRTGRLLGDLIDVFHSRPLLYGGPAASEGLTSPLPARVYGCYGWEEVVLMEKPRAPKGRWYMAGAAVAALALVGVVAKVSHSSLSKSKTLDEIENWEELPGMDQVIHKAQALKMDKPLRNLQDLFYDSQPEELPWIRTECVIDTVQAAAYLAQAVVFLYKAIDYDGLECPNNSPVGCAASVAGFITSITWIASYLCLGLCEVWGVGLLECKSKASEMRASHRDCLHVPSRRGPDQGLRIQFTRCLERGIEVYTNPRGRRR
ncbi:unnamed protein product, partial [Symbiodinium sp. CCMP2456]